MINSVIFDKGSVYVKFNEYAEPLIIPSFPHYVMTKEKSTAKYPSPFDEYGTNVDTMSIKRKVNLNDIQQQFNLMLTKHTEPRLEDNKWGRTFYIDIETGIGESFPEPAYAQQPITTISITSQTLKTIVITYNPNYNFDRSFGMYNEIASKILNENPKLKRISAMDDKPMYQIIKVQDERALLNVFLNFVKNQCDYAFGWNFINFDWLYIYNRCFNVGVAWTQCCVGGMYEQATFTDKNGNITRFKMPFGCQVFDLMNCVDAMDYSLGAKESMSLDYIADRCFGVGKLKYNYPLKELYDKDIDQYIAYNGIDTFLTACIDIKLNINLLLREYSKIGTIPMYKCQSMIALTNALFNKHFNAQGKFIGECNDEKERYPFEGGYVREPQKGKWSWVTCNDFAALYPSTIRTCNISPESIVHIHLQDEEKLKQYKSDPNYFVSINNNVYKNDKDYSYKILQTYLTNERNPRKYIGKEINAKLMPIVDEYTQENIDKIHSASENTIKWWEENYQMSVDDIITICNSGSDEDKFILKSKLEDAVESLDIQQLALKRYSNSLYGGVSNKACSYFQMPCAEDITGEGRNATHTMEICTLELWNRYIFMPEYTKKFKNIGLTLNISEYNKSLKTAIENETTTKYVDDDGKSYNFFDNIVYGDTDSLYITYQDVFNWFDETREADFDTRYEYMLKLVDITNEYYAKRLLDYYKGRNCRSPEIQNFEIETVARYALHFMKKQYIQYLVWKDGKDLRHHPKLKKIGLEIVKGSTSAFAREVLTEALHEMLVSDDFDWRKYLDDKYAEFRLQPLGRIAGNHKLNPSNFKKWIVTNTQTNEYEGIKGTPYQYKAAANFNNIINKFGYTADYQELRDGKCHILPSFDDWGYIAFPDEDPIPQVKQVCNIDEQWNKTIFDVLDRLTSKIDGREEAALQVKEEKKALRELKKLQKMNEEPKPKKTRKSPTAEIESGEVVTTKATKTTRTTKTTRKTKIPVLPLGYIDEDD